MVLVVKYRHYSQVRDGIERIIFYGGRKLGRSCFINKLNVGRNYLELVHLGAINLKPVRRLGKFKSGIHWHRIADIYCRLKDCKLASRRNEGGAFALADIYIIFVCKTETVIYFIYSSILILIFNIGQSIVTAWHYPESPGPKHRKLILFHHACPQAHAAAVYAGFLAILLAVATGRGLVQIGIT